MLSFMDFSFCKPRQPKGYACSVRCLFRPRALSILSRLDLSKNNKSSIKPGGGGGGGGGGAGGGGGGGGGAGGGGGGGVSVSGATASGLSGRVTATSRTTR